MNSKQGSTSALSNSHQLLRLPVQDRASTREGGDQATPPPRPAEDLLAVDRYWGKKSQFSRGWLWGGCPCSSKWPYTHARNGQC